MSAPICASGTTNDTLLSGQRIPLLDATNYSRWRTAIIFYLRLKMAWGIVSGVEQAPLVSGSTVIGTPSRRGRRNATADLPAEPQLADVSLELCYSDDPCCLSYPILTLLVCSPASYCW